MASEKFFSVKNLEKFQHYKHRNPPWIKLHQDVLENYEFANLTDVEKGHLMLIWVLASRSDNRLPIDSDWIGKRINAKSKVNLQLLITLGFLVVEQSASNALASCVQSADSESEKSRDRAETETEAFAKKQKKSQCFSKPSIQQISAYCRERSNNVDPQQWLDHYESNGWKVGRNPMKDWKAAVRQWERNSFSPGNTPKERADALGDRHRNGPPPKVQTYVRDTIKYEDGFRKTIRQELDLNRNVIDEWEREELRRPDDRSPDEIKQEMQHATSR